ncbi:hypothetical protein OV090_34940 [Nannocystis sp. RBIL2]|uniref:hypothetical protein n=1 Tax=Nannocystis sp. RBIL2 TaxID=2996788 RepID=UPI00226DBEBC|nr:hypothetical protein [Nannocystis sp. RBIL2]MCY1069992.1 hypothetical protein [Nannocystis sp. RBIL2]
MAPRTSASVRGATDRRAREPARAIAADKPGARPWVVDPAARGASRIVDSPASLSPAEIAGACESGPPS